MSFSCYFTGCRSDLTVGVPFNSPPSAARWKARSTGWADNWGVWFCPLHAAEACDRGRRRAVRHENWCPRVTRGGGCVCAFAWREPDGADLYGQGIGRRRIRKVRLSPEQEYI